MADIYLVKLDKVNVNIDEEGNITSMEVYIPNNQIAATDKEGRNKLEGKNYTKEEKIERIEYFENQLNGNELKLNNMRWPAGGLVYMTADGSFIFLRRDGQAPSYPNYLTIASGLGRNEEEVYNPKITMLREGLEEIGIYDTERKEILIPNISNFEEGNKIMEMMTNKHKKLIESTANNGKYEIILEQGNKSVNIYGNKSNHIFVPSINIDPKTNGIDLLGIVKIPFKVEDLKKYRIFDGEGFERDIVILTKEEAENAIEGKGYIGLVIPFNGDPEFKQIKYPLTPVAITSIASSLGKPTDKNQILSNLNEWRKQINQ